MKTTPCTGEMELPGINFAFNLAPRCGANTRAGTPCKSPAIRLKKRCRMHGGKGSGAPKDNQNAFKHGLTTPQVIIFLKRAKLLLKECNLDLKNVR